MDAWPASGLPRGRLATTLQLPGGAHDAGYGQQHNHSAFFLGDENAKLVPHIVPLQMGWDGQALSGMGDTATIYDNYSGAVFTRQQQPGRVPAPSGNGRVSGSRNSSSSDRNSGGSRRAKGYRRLWEQVKCVGRGDALDGDGRTMHMCEFSVEEVVRLVRSLPADQSCIPTVSPALHYLDSRALAAMLKELAKSGLLARAMEMFDWLRSLEPGAELAGLCDVYTYTTAISLMGQAQQLRRALELVAELRSRGIECNVHTYSALMNVCIKCDACDLALDVFKQMRGEGIKPNVVTYNTLVDVYGKTGQWERAVNVLGEMQLEGLEPEVRTFNTAIIACNMCGQPAEALKVYDKLLEAGLQPISTTYTALISAHGKAGNLDRALDTFQAMIRAGCERSVITYSALISACEKAGKWELALQLFEQMHAERCTPNTVTYNSLITACAQGAQWEKASEVFEQMKYQGCRPDVVTYTALIGAYERGGQWRSVVKTFDAMQAQGCKPDSFVHQTLVDVLWCTGVVWAQARALALYNNAARNWPYRFCVQQQTNPEGGCIEYAIPAGTSSGAMLALHRWLTELRLQLDKDGMVVGVGKERLVLSLGRMRNSRDQGSNSSVRATVQAMLNVLDAPFVSVESSSSSSTTFEASTQQLLAWLSSYDLPQRLCGLLMPAGPPPSAFGQQPQQPGLTGHGNEAKKLLAGCAAELHADAALEQQCTEAYHTVQNFEQMHRVESGGMSSAYLTSRQSYVERGSALAEALALRQETAYDACLLMDRVMATGTQVDDQLGPLFSAATLLIAARQGESPECVPSDAQVDAANGFAPGSVAKMEVNIRSALGGNTTAISSLRCVKLYFERLGLELQDGFPQLSLHAGVLARLRAALVSRAFLQTRPTVVAAAVIYADRVDRGAFPAWPSALAAMTGLASPAAPELAAAVEAMASLGLDKPRPKPQRRASMIVESSTSAMSLAMGLVRHGSLPSGAGSLPNLSGFAGALSSGSGGPSSSGLNSSGMSSGMSSSLSASLSHGLSCELSAATSTGLGHAAAGSNGSGAMGLAGRSPPSRSNSRAYLLGGQGGSGSGNSSPLASAAVSRSSGSSTAPNPLLPSPLNTAAAVDAVTAAIQGLAMLPATSAESMPQLAAPGALHHLLPMASAAACQPGHALQPRPPGLSANSSALFSNGSNSGSNSLFSNVSAAMQMHHGVGVMTLEPMGPGLLDSVSAGLHQQQHGSLSSQLGLPGL